MLARAAELPLYRTLWRGRTPSAFEESPFLSSWEWRRQVSRDPARGLAGGAGAVLWARQPIAGDDPIWVPFAREDIIAAARRSGTVFRRAGIVPGDVVLSVAPEGPWVGNAIPYLISGTDALVPDAPPLGAEVLPLSALTVSFKADLTLFPFSRSPSVIVGSAADIGAILAAARSAGAASLRSRLLLLFGPAVAPAALSDLAEVRVDLLYLPGAFAPFGGRPGEAGVWLPDDAVRGELIPDDEWGRTVTHPGFQPQALPLAEAGGLSGELVVSLDNQALPVIRFRTQERVRVAEVDPGRGVRIERLSSALQAGREDSRRVG